MDYDSTVCTVAVTRYQTKSAAVDDGLKGTCTLCAEGDPLRDRALSQLDRPFYLIMDYVANAKPLSAIGPAIASRVFAHASPGTRVFQVEMVHQLVCLTYIVHMQKVVSTCEQLAEWWSVTCC
jgi:hypothetical protein